MAKYVVTVEWRKTKEVYVFARDEVEAESKALEKVESWGIDDVEVLDVDETD